jgi:hypothetical protein
MCLSVSEQTREIGLPGSRESRMPMQVPAGAEGASGRRRCQRGRRPQHRCERGDARDSERAAREHRMRSRCAAGAEGARAAEGHAAPPPFPHQRLSRNFGYSELFKLLRVGVLNSPSDELSNANLNANETSSPSLPRMNVIRGAGTRLLVARSSPFLRCVPLAARSPGGSFFLSRSFL